MVMPLLLALNSSPSMMNYGKWKELSRFQEVQPSTPLDHATSCSLTLIQENVLTLDVLERDIGKNITLVFDLDETLIHCVENFQEGYDFSLDIYNSVTKLKTKVLIYFN